MLIVVVYYESRKRELQIRLMNEGRCDERLKTRVEESTFLTYTGFHDKTNEKYLEIKMRSTRVHVVVFSQKNRLSKKKRD